MEPVELETKCCRACQCPPHQRHADFCQHHSNNCAFPNRSVKSQRDQSQQQCPPSDTKTLQGYQHLQKDSKTFLLEKLSSSLFHFSWQNHLPTEVQVSEMHSHVFAEGLQLGTDFVDKLLQSARLVVDPG